jgi:NAD-dependent deacetylase
LSAQAGSANNGSIQTVVFENPLGDPVSDTSTIETAVHALADLLMASQNTVFFTGAGISTESGIPDFRSPGTGLWNKIRPIEFQDFVNSAKSRRESWERKFANDVMASAVPNAGHRAVQEWFALGHAGGVITQNVDNLHQDSGLEDHLVVELHGNATYARCLSCSARYGLDAIRAEFEQHGEVAPCPRCGGLIKTATISFGQSMPEAEMAKAQQFTEACDLMIVLGSSLTVYPAAGFPQYAKQLGASLVIINREPTDHDDIADLVIHESIGEVMSQAVARTAH